MIFVAVFLIEAKIIKIGNIIKTYLGRAVKVPEEIGIKKFNKANNK